MCTSASDDKGGEGTELEVERREVMAGLNNLHLLIVTLVYILGPIIIMC